MAPRSGRLLAVMGLAALPACNGTGESPLPTAASPGDTSDVDGAWRDEVQRHLVDDQYVVRPDAGGLIGWNPRNELSARWSEDGVRVEADGDEVSLRVTGFGREDHTALVGAVAPVVGECADPARVDAFGMCLGRVEYEHGSLVEWWTNEPAGLHHGFHIATPPAGDGWVDIAVDVGGA